MTPVVPVKPVTTGNPPKTKPTNTLTNPNKNPYPNDPNAKFVNGQWMDVATPAQKKSTAAALKKKPGTAGLTALQKLLGKGGPKGAPGSDFDPLAGMPKQTALTAFPTFDASTLPDGSDVPDSPAHAFKSSKAQLLDPNKFADLVGAKSYAPLIAALTSQQSRLGSGVADANAMMDKSYGAASDASYKGAQIINDSNAQANQGLTDLAARLAQVAGGDPTAAAAVGQATANQQSSNTRFADVAAQAQADQAAAAQRDLGTAKLGYKASTDKTIADLASTLGQTKAQASQDQGKGLEEALGFNSQQQTAQQGRDVAGQEAWLAGQLAGPQITAGKLANEGTRAGMKINAHNVAVNDWTSINAGKRQQYLDAVTKWTNKNVAQQMKTALAAGKTPGAELALADPTVYRSVKSDLDPMFTTKSGPAADPGTVYTQAIRAIKSQYPDSSGEAIKALALRYAQGQMTMWNAQHAKGQAQSGKTFKIVNGAPALVAK